MEVPGWMIAVLGILGSVSLVWALVRIWYRRLERAPAWDDPPPPEPTTVRDAFAATLSEDHGHRRRGAKALTDGDLSIVPLDPTIEVLWSARFDAASPVWLYEEATDAGLLVALTAWSEASDAGDLAARIEGRFGVAPRCVLGNGMLYAAIASGGAVFDQLALVAGLAWLRPTEDAVKPTPRAAAAAVSFFVDGVEHGCLPPFGRLIKRGDAICAVADNALSHRYRARPRLTFAHRVVEIPSEALANASEAAPNDPVADGIQLRVLGGDVDAVKALA